MEKVKRLRANLKDERLEFRSLEDKLESVLDERLDADVTIQTTTKKIRDLKDPKFDPSAIANAQERNEILKAQKKKLDTEKETLKNDEEQAQADIVTYTTNLKSLEGHDEVNKPL